MQNIILINMEGSNHEIIYHRLNVDLTFIFTKQK